MTNYPVKFWVENHGRHVVLSCEECGCHYSYDDIVELGELVIESQVHQDMHLIESLRGRAPEMAPPEFP